MEGLELWANWVLMWIGFGTLVGLAAKGIMPGRDPGGTVATLAMGIGGAIIGCGVLKFFWEEQKITPLSPAGFVVAAGGAFIILFFYRLLAGYWFYEDQGVGAIPRPHHTRRRRRSYVQYDE